MICLCTARLGNRQYLDDAIVRYGPFFASVNGDMFWNGVQLWKYTGQQHFYDKAIATAQSVDRNPDTPRHYCFRRRGYRPERHHR
ncbi:MAG TPA: hypothetical protein VKT72_17040 [Candidatus Baltobacteraceae bacterium]|nr:hypothetical protein [Candidatus Baltobacteraceae bacterium]